MLVYHEIRIYNTSDRFKVFWKSFTILIIIPKEIILIVFIDSKLVLARVSL